MAIPVVLRVPRPTTRRCRTHPLTAAPAKGKRQSCSSQSSEALLQINGVIPVVFVRFGAKSRGSLHGPNLRIDVCPLLSLSRSPFGIFVLIFQHLRLQVDIPVRHRVRCADTGAHGHLGGLRLHLHPNTLATLGIDVPTGNYMLRRNLDANVSPWLSAPQHPLSGPDVRVSMTCPRRQLWTAKERGRFAELCCTSWLRPQCPPVSVAARNLPRPPHNKAIANGPHKPFSK